MTPGLSGIFLYVFGKLSLKKQQTKNPWNQNSKGFSFYVEKMGVEPTTSCMPCKRSSQLSYIPIAGANIRQFFFTVQIL
jgi:hypothetical protein